MDRCVNIIRIKHARTFGSLLTPIGLNSNHKRYDIQQSKMVTLRTCTINKLENININVNVNVDVVGEGCLLLTGGDNFFGWGKEGDDEVRVKNI